MDKVQYKGEDHDGLSPNIWADCPILEIAMDPSKGFGFFDDFINFAKHDSTQDEQQYESYVDSGVIIEHLEDVTGGVAQVHTNGTNDYEGNLSCHGPMVEISDTAGEEKKLWFEARISKEHIDNNSCALFVGLAYDHNAPESVAKENALADDGELGAFSFLGFHIDHDDGNAMDFVYRAYNQTAVVLIAGVHVPEAAEYVKVGFKYDPDEDDADKRIKIYVDNVLQSTYVTDTQIAAATFPDAEPMCPAWLTKCGSVGAESTCEMDWWGCYQLR